MLDVMRMILISVAALLSGLDAGAALAGQSTHGGDNRNAGDTSAWFLGASKVIRYCHVKDEAFGVPDEELDLAIARAFTTWRDYMVRKLPLADIERFDPRRTFTLQTQRENCDGSQDLKFYFGLKDEVVIRELGYYDDPAAFAHRLSYDGSAGWSKGIIWLSNPRSYSFLDLGDGSGARAAALSWQDPHVLDTILLHELGHVFGNGHVDGTVMDENILKLVLAPKLFPGRCGSYTAGFARIDDRHELVPCYRCSTERLAQSWYGTADEAIFEHMVGRKPIGGATARLYLEPADTGWRLEMDFADLTGTFRRAVDVFKSALPTVKDSLGARGEHVFELFFLHDGKSHFGSFVSKSTKLAGERFELLLNDKAEDTPVVLYFRDPLLVPKARAFEADSSAAQCRIPSLQSLPFWLFAS